MKSRQPQDTLLVTKEGQKWLVELSRSDIVKKPSLEKAKVDYSEPSTDDAKNRPKPVFFKVKKQPNMSKNIKQSRTNFLDQAEMFRSCAKIIERSYNERRRMTEFKHSKIAEQARDKYIEPHWNYLNVLKHKRTSVSTGLFQIRHRSVTPSRRRSSKNTSQSFSHV